MARQLAKNAQLMVSETGEGEPNLLEALASWTYDKSKTEVDVTGVYDANKQYVPGQGDARGDFTVIVDPESETLGILETAQKADSLVYIYYRPDGTGASKPQDKIPAYITGLSYSASVDGRVDVQCLGGQCGVPVSRPRDWYAFRPFRLVDQCQYAGTNR